MRKAKKALSVTVISALLLCTSSSNIYAKDLTMGMKADSTVIDAIQLTDINSSNSTIMSESTCHKNIYYGVDTLIYTGKGKDRWIHIVPHTTPNTFTIKMYQYNSNKPIYSKTFVANDTTHWFVGSDIQRVYLTGMPGGIVCVTDTDH